MLDWGGGQEIEEPRKELSVGWSKEEEEPRTECSVLGKKEKKKERLVYVEVPPWERKGFSQFYFIFLFAEERSIRLHLQIFLLFVIIFL